MTMIAPHAAGPWMSRAELAQASGLREDLIARFIPSTDTPTGPMYPAQQMALAVYVKELTDRNLPAAAVDEKVREFTARPPAPATHIPLSTKPNRRGLWTAVGGAATAALIVGGAIGAMIGSSNTGTSTAVPAPTVTVEAAPQFKPTIPAAPDPVCAEWAPIADSYNAKLQAWSAKSVNEPASAWSDEQRALNMGTIPVFQDQISDLRRLADKAEDPFLAGLLRAQAMYVEAAVLRLPNYEPSDQPLWMAAYDFSGAVRAACKTVVPR